MVEFDVDMEYLTKNNELDCVVLNDENGVMESMRFIPEHNYEEFIDKSEAR